MTRWIYRGFAILLVFFSHKANSANFVIDCNNDPITIRLTPKGLKSLTATYSDYIYISRKAVSNVTTLPSSCFQLGSFAIVKAFFLNVTECYPYITMNETYLFLSWSFRYIPAAPVILRYNETCVNVTCAYNRTQLVSSGAISPTLQKVLVGAVNAQGGFSASLTLFRDVAFSNQLTAGSIIMVNSYFLVRVSINTAPALSSRFIVQMRKCWATTTSSPTSSPSYALITDSCSADSAYVSIIRNYQPHNGTFNVSAFIWTTNVNLPIYIHCDVSICDSAATGANCSLPGCSTGSRRRRRDIDTDMDIANRREIISYGPIHILPQGVALKCSQNNGGCTDICSMNDDEVVCSCPFGSILGVDGKTCYELSEGYKRKILVNSNDPLFIAALVMVVLALLMSFVFFITRRRATVKAI